jgi:hypothetical protein
MAFVKRGKVPEGEISVISETTICKVCDSNLSEEGLCEECCRKEEGSLVQASLNPGERTCDGMCSEGCCECGVPEGCECGGNCKCKK